MKRSFQALCFREGDRPEGKRILRGGSWNNNPNNMRSANRNRNNTDNRNNNNGFRLVQSAHDVCFEAVSRSCVVYGWCKRGMGVHESVSRLDMELGRIVAPGMVYAGVSSSLKAPVYLEEVLCE